MYQISLENKQLIFGSSSETKPTQLPTSSQFLEMDTTNFYIFNGSSWDLSTDHKIIKSLTDFPTPSAGVITLEDNITYIINGSVDISTNTITAGIRNSITGVDRLNDKLISQTTGVMITTNGSALSLLLNNLTIQCPNGAVFNINDSSLNVVETSFSDCETMGTFDDAPAITFRQSGFINAFDTGGGVFTGSANGTFKFFDNTVVNCVGTLLDFGTSIFSVIDISRNVATVNASQVFLDGTTGGANVSVAGSLVDNIFSGAGTPVDTILNSDTNWRFTNNVGVSNTSISASISITEIEIDFGSTPVTEKTFTIIDAGVSAASKILCVESGNVATGRVAGDSLWDSIVYSAVGGTGEFTLYARSSGAVVGKRKLLYTFA